MTCSSCNLLIPANSHLIIPGQCAHCTAHMFESQDRDSQGGWEAERHNPDNFKSPDFEGERMESERAFAMEN